MMEFVPVLLPQMGANDTFATIVEWAKENGEQVKTGEIICYGETTKSLFEIEAVSDGFLSCIIPTGNDADVGDPVAVISTEPATHEQVQAWLEQWKNERSAAQNADSGSSGNWTMKAKLLADQHGIDIADVPASGAKVTESDVQAFLASPGRRPVVTDTVEDPYPSGRIARILIIGGGDGAVQVLDAIAKTPGQRGAGIVDDNPALQGKSVMGVPVVGGIDVEKIAEMFRKNEYDGAVVSISTNIAFRSAIFEKLSAAGVRFANIIHPSAVVGANVSMGSGNIILAFCHIGPCATVGDNNFLSPYCSIEHHNVLGNGCSFGPGVLTSSKVHIGDRSRFGTGVFIEPHIHIGKESVVASGCIIWKDVPESTILKSKLNYSSRQRGERG